jgi:hypothetical protein
MTDKSVLTGLDAMKKRIEEQENKFQDFGPRVKYISLDDGKSLRFRPLQEIDESSPNYDKDRGLAQMNVEHSHPQMWLNKGLCSMDEQGQCYGCEQDWSQKLRFYLNVEVQAGDESFVAVMSQGNGPKSVTPTLLDYAEETGSLTDKVFKLIRKGEKRNTAWGAILLKETKDDLPDLELFDLSLIVKQIPYDQQEAHYNRVWKKDGDDIEPSGLDEFAKDDADEKW